MNDASMTARMCLFARAYHAETYGIKVFDDSLAACRGARSAKMRVVGVHDSFFNRDEKEMRAFCDVYIDSFEQLLYTPEQKARRK